MNFASKFAYVRDDDESSDEDVGDEELSYDLVSNLSPAAPPPPPASLGLAPPMPTSLAASGLIGQEKAEEIQLELDEEEMEDDDDGGAGGGGSAAGERVSKRKKRKMEKMDRSDAQNRRFSLRKQQPPPPQQQQQQQQQQMLPQMLPPAPQAPQRRGLLSSLFSGWGSSSASAPSAPSPSPFSLASHSSIPTPLRSRAPAPEHRQKMKAKTNVVAIEFSTLANKAEDLFAGDPVHCSKCEIVLSSTSIVREMDRKGDDADIPADDDGQVWVCEFCGGKNVIDVQPEEIPKSEMRDYILVPAPEKKQVDKNAGKVVFCIDISGSMGVTQPAPRGLKLKTKKIEIDIPAELREFIPQQQDNSKYVSRLQCVQTSIDSQLESWAKTDQEKRVGLVTFAQDVVVIGDGTREVVTVAGGKLSNEEKLREIGTAAGALLTQGAKDTAEPLSKKLWDLEEKGATALGPALVVGASMAATQLGSTLVLCTDGLANVGIGALDTADDAKKQEIEAWYEGVGHAAKASGTTVNIISIKGAECDLEALGKVAEITGGTVERVDPLQLGQNFKGILEKPILATQVSATMVLHPLLQFAGDLSNKKQYDVGNVNTDTEVTFEYERKKNNAQQQQQQQQPQQQPQQPQQQVPLQSKASAAPFPLAAAQQQPQQPQQPQPQPQPQPAKEEGKEGKDAKEEGKEGKDAKEGAKPSELKSIPFQLQIRYTTMDGMKCLRVISRSLALTASKQVAEENVASPEILAANAAQKSAQLVKEGRLHEARGHNLAMGKLLQKSNNRQVTSQYLSRMGEWDRNIQQQQVQMEDMEAKESPAELASCGLVGGGGPVSAPSSSSSSSESSRRARKARTDADYSLMQNISTTSSKKWAK